MGEHDREVGWYLDPTDRRRHRWWNGTSWETEPERLGERDPDAA